MTKLAKGRVNKENSGDLEQPMPCGDPTVRAIGVDVRRSDSARRGLAVFFLFLILGSGIVHTLLIRTKDPIDKHLGLVFALMWTPGIASVFARILCREGVADISIRVGGKGAVRPLLVAWIYPVLVGMSAYGVAWLVGLAEFQVVSPAGLAVAHPGMRFLRRLAITMTIGIPLSALTAAGEELGWRGYMVTRLIDARVPRPILASGAIWGMWHMPLIVTGQYASGPYPLASAALFLVSIIPAAHLHAYVRLASGSVWPAVIAHAAWNSIIQGAFDTSTKGGSSTHTTSIWVGESGILVCLASVAVAFAVLPKQWTMKRAPESEGQNLGPALRL